MPDVTITCPSCNNVITVSEFVDLTQLVCRACGTRFVPSAAEEPTPDGQPAPHASAPSEPVVIITEAPDAVVPAKVVPRLRKRFRMTYQLKCWTVFASLGGVILLLRYSRLLGSDSTEALAEYGPYVVIGFWFYVTFRAFRESILSGILCLLVPFYAIYYAFWCFEDYMFRAIFGAVLVATGVDSFNFMMENGSKILPAINEFLTSGL